MLQHEARCLVGSMLSIQYNWFTDFYYKLLNHNHSIATEGGIIILVQLPVQLPYATI